MQCNGAKISSRHGAGTNRHPHAKNMYLSTGLTPFTKINSKWITDLNIKHKTIKLLEDNIGEDLGDFGYGEAFLDTTPKVKIMK